MGDSSAAGTKDSKFLKSVLRNPDQYESAPNREQVFKNVLDLGDNIQDLDQNLKVI